MEPLPPERPTIIRFLSAVFFAVVIALFSKLTSCFLFNNHNADCYIADLKVVTYSLTNLLKVHQVRLEDLAFLEAFESE
jgi:hypothetical protein